MRVHHNSSKRGQDTHCQKGLVLVFNKVLLEMKLCKSPNASHPKFATQCVYALCKYCFWEISTWCKIYSNSFKNVLLQVTLAFYHQYHFGPSTVVQLAVSPYPNCAGKTQTLHLHLGPFGRSQKAPYTRIWCLHLLLWTSVPTMNVR